MKLLGRISIVLATLLLSIGSLSAATTRAGELLERLSASFRAMGGYSVAFAVTAGENTVRGSYSIEGERYTLTLGDAEVFCDGKVRHEVDNRRREVTLTQVDPTSRNILNNPAHAFDFLDSDYSSTLLWERDGKALIRLIPAVKGGVGVITLTLNVSTLRPEALTYDFDGENITVTISGVTTLKGSVASFPRSKYVNYEFIDFR